MAEPLRVGKLIFRVGQDVGDMDEFAFQQRAATCVSALRHDGKVFNVFHEFLREPIRLCAIKNSTLLAGDGAAVGLTKAGGRFNKRLQYRLQVERRTADDFEHVGRGGLLLQRLPQLVEQPRVLDGDDGLGGKVRDQRYLFVGKWPNLLAINVEGANDRTFLQH